MVAAGVAARETFTPAIGATALPFITLFPIVAVAAWFGGLGPGLLSIAVSALAATWFFIEPIHALAIGSLFSAVALLAYASSALVIVVAIGEMHRVRAKLKVEVERTQRAQTVLRVTLDSIGDGVVATDALGCVTFLNGEAERLTGWTDEAMSPHQRTEKSFGFSHWMRAA